MGTVTFKDASGATVLGPFTTNAVVAAGASGYELVDYQVSGSQRRRDVATSPYVGGEQEITSVRGAAAVTLVVRCVGASTWAQAHTQKAALIAAAEQTPTWILDLSIGSATFSYLCRAADWSLDGRRELLLSKRLEVTLTIPVKVV